MMKKKSERLKKGANGNKRINLEEDQGKNKTKMGGSWTEVGKESIKLIYYHFMTQLLLTKVH